MSDIALQRAIMRSLAENPIVHVDEIAVQVLDDEVVLRGTVGSEIQRAEAERATRRVAGSRPVDDQLQVRVMGIDGRTDADTEAAVLDVLIADDELDSTEVEVESRDGTVTLRGIVPFEPQLERAERDAQRVPGVSRVRNELRVWVAVSADDVAERITDAIGVGAFVGADQITVNVLDLDVTLTGTVTSEAHREAAVAAAASAPGVAVVHDELTVGPPAG